MRTNSLSWMSSSRNNDHLIALFVANCEQWDLPSLKCFTQAGRTNFILVQSQKFQEMAIGIGKAVGKLHAIRVIRFKKISKMKLIRCSFLLILMISISVIYFGTSSSPYIFLSLFITDFHSFIIEARTFSKSLDDKFGLPFKSFDYEIKPCRNTIGVEFFCQSYLVCSRSYFLDSLYIA